MGLWQYSCHRSTFVCFASQRCQVPHWDHSIGMHFWTSLSFFPEHLSHYLSFSSRNFPLTKEFIFSKTTGFFTYSSLQKPYPRLCITLSLTANVLCLHNLPSSQTTLTQLVSFLGCFLAWLLFAC